MDITHILNQVESPFTDEEIINLTKKFIECNCDMSQFYRSVNINMEQKENPYLTELYSRLFSISNRGERFVEGNDSWNIVGSNKEALSVPYEIESRVPIYRIYVNAKGQDKARIVEEYIRRCESTGQAYKLKYSKTDGRNDEILVLSYSEDLTKNIELIESITEGMSLGGPAPLTGKYKEKIGIGEEYIQAPIYSYTQTRLGIIPIIMQKYFLEHKPEFNKYLDDSNKGLGDFLLKHSEKMSARLSKQIATLSEDDEQRKEELKNKQFAYNNNIDPNIGNMYQTICQFIPEAMKEYMSNNFETAIPEIIENYHLACEIFGISKNGVFSKRTEAMLEQPQQTPLQKREAELSALEMEAKGYDEAEALLSQLQQKEGQDIGE